MICLDGATFDLLGPWMAAGRLPALQRLRDEGVSGELESVVPPLTAPAFASFMTGQNPGRHGVYHFVDRRPGDDRATFVDATTRAGQTLWRLLSDDGRRVLVLNVPTTYPPEPVNGVLIADFLTPPGRRDFTYPRAVLEEVERRFGPYPLHLRTLMFSASLSRRNGERLLAELHHELTYKFDVTHYLLDRNASDLAVVHLLGTDRVQHELWNAVDPRHPRHDAATGARLGEAVARYFTAVDAQVDRLVRRFDDHTVVVISDHGFGPMHRAIDLNAWLLQEGYIALKRTGRSRLRARLWRAGVTNELVVRTLLRTVFRHGAGLAGAIPDETIFKIVEFFAHRGQRNPLLSMDDVDWSRTRAYAQVGLGAINVNLAGREPAGSVAPGQYEALKAELATRLQTLRDPQTGARVGGRVVRREEVYRGPYVERAPDIVFVPGDTGYVAGSLMGFTANRPIVDALGWTGHHRMNGIFLARGPRLRRGARIEGARLIDVAPTLLHLLGSRIPPEMDGQVLAEIFEEGFLAGRPIAYRERREPELDARTPPADDARVLKRLRDLGYVV